MRNERRKGTRKGKKEKDTFKKEKGAKNAMEETLQKREREKGEGGKESAE